MCFVVYAMKIQLTKTKAIEIGGGSRRGPSDVVGVELTSRDPRGCPAVRLVRRRGELTVVAAGFVPPPTEAIPTSWEEKEKSRGRWSLPPPFQAPVAAVAVDGPDAVARQTTLENLSSEMVGLKTEVKPGEPVSFEGRRLVVSSLADEGFVLQAGLPEYQTLWLSRFFPEGHRPVVASVQVSAVARLGALVTQPEFIAAGGSGMSVFVSERAVHFAGWSQGRLALFRRCPGSAGWGPVREAVKARLSLDDSLIDEVLDGSMVDPCFAMESFVRPVFRELALSIDYLAHRMNVRTDWVYLMGLPSGGGYWNKIAETTAKLSFIVPHAFDGLELSAKKGTVPQLSTSESQVFLGALGAARSLMEDPA